MDVLNFCKFISGSIMSTEDILNEYKHLNIHKRKLLFDKGRVIARKYDGPIDRSRPILVIQYGLISAEYNIDPAIVALATILKGKAL